MADISISNNTDKSSRFRLSLFNKDKEKWWNRHWTFHGWWVWERSIISFWMKEVRWQLTWEESRWGTYILPPGEEQSKKIKVKRPLLSDVASSASIMYFTASFPKKLNGGNTSTKWLDGSCFFHSCIVVNKIVCLALYYYALIKDFLQSSF